MKDVVIDAARWHLESDPLPERMLERIRESYGALLSFLKQNHLLRDGDFEKSIIDWRQFELKVSDLTEEGDELARRCHDKWLRFLDKGGDRKDVRIWERELDKMRSVSRQ